MASALTGGGIGPLTGPPILSGDGSPEGVVQAIVGALYRRTDGGSGTTLYVKEEGENTETGWVPAGATPIGSILDFAGSVAPAGFLLCFGQSVATATYPNLFAVIGYTYGGSGANFSIPDLRGIVCAGRDDMGGSNANRLNNWGGTNVNLGAFGGEATHVLSVSELASHQHGGVDHLHSLQNHQHYTTCALMNYTGTARGGSGTFSIDNTNIWSSGPNVGTTGAADRALTTGAAGSNLAHNVCQPTRILNKIIKT
jgi:microcystin-dependent protein